MNIDHPAKTKPMPFGKYKGQLIGTIDMTYFKYLLDNGYLEKHPEIKDYAVKLYSQKSIWSKR
jgi:hypothetical protein